MRHRRAMWLRKKSVPDKEIGKAVESVRQNQTYATVIEFVWRRFQSYCYRGISLIHSRPNSQKQNTPASCSGSTNLVLTIHRP